MSLYELLTFIMSTLAHPAAAWQALSRRLDDVVAIGKQAGSLKSAFAQLDQVVKGMRPQARPSTPPSPGSSTQAHTGESGDQNSEGAGGKQAPASGDGHP
eukprot:683317-Pelagomonas_calceolata.AAC.6